MAHMSELAAVMSVAQGGAKIFQGMSQRSAYGAEASATERAADIEAASLKMRADETRAAANMEAREKRKAAEKVMGRQVAVAADSGGGAADSTILDIIGETAERGELQAQAEQYKGESQARGLEDKAKFGKWRAGTQAASARMKGEAAFTGSIFEGVTKAGEGVYKYGDRKGWFSETKPSSDDTELRTGWRTRVYRGAR